MTISILRAFLLVTIVGLSLFVAGVCIRVEYLNGRGNLTLPRDDSTIKWREPSPMEFKESHWKKYIELLSRSINEERVKHGADPDSEIYLDPMSKSVRSRYYTDFEKVYYRDIQDIKAEQRQIADIELYNFITIFGILQCIAILALIICCCVALYLRGGTLSYSITGVGLSLALACGVLAIYREYLTSF